MYANYHTHHELCGHAVGNCEDYAKAAVRLGFRELGFSDHGPILKEFLPQKDFHDFGMHLQMDYSDFLNVYLPECKLTQQRYKDKLSIKIGLEIEYIPSFHNYFANIRKTVDYLALGLHFHPKKDGSWQNVYEPMDEEAIQEYADVLCQAMDTKLYKMVTHPDIFLMMYRKNGEYVFDEVAKSISAQIIESAIRNDVYFEINAGGPRRSRFWKDGRENYLYPRYDFWKFAEQYPKLKIILGSDAHAPEHLYDEITAETEKFASQFQFKIEKSVQF